jgi:polyisoprenoid-binding protein YceI
MLFSVRHMVISEAVGYFKEWDLKVTASNDDWSDAAIEGTIEVASINTDNDRRDTHLKSDDFFNAEKFPQLEFKSTSFEKVDENKFKVRGSLTMRDITKDVVFDADLLGRIDDQRGGARVGWKIVGQVNRFDYGLKWNRTIETGGLVAGETVTITLNLELIKQAS